MSELSVALQVLASTPAGTSQLAPAPMISTIPRLSSEAKVLAVGDNTFVAPVVGASICVIVFDSTNLSTYKLKSDAGDLGLDINKLGNYPFLMIPTNDSIVITAAGGPDTVPTQIYWF